MPELRTYNLFISHAWDYSSEYYRLKAMLDSAPNFRWKDMSVPVHNPTNGALRQQFIDRIQLTHAFLVTCGMYCAYSNWMLTEIRIAKNLNKPIIGVVPQGQERVPQAVQDVADEIVGWNTNSIVEAIRRLAI
jgi:hypothetical protein